MLDREFLYQLLFKKEWDQLSEQLHTHKKLLNQDPVLQQIANLFETEFLGYLEGLTALEKVTATRHISLVILSERRAFKKSFWLPLIEIKLQAMYEVKDKSLASVASEWANDIPLAHEMLVRLHQTRPEELAEARRSSVNIKVASVASSETQTRYVTSIFRSPQELAFYLAMTDVAPKMLVYPNLPMSVALDFQALEKKIPASATSFFFSAQFDCVIVDPAQDYRPLHFFELDSKFHDTADAKKRDRMKNEICSAAGVKLLRIRAFEQKETTREAFVQLIREILMPVVA